MHADAPDTAPDTVHRIPLAEIDPAALPRDRTCLANADMDELRNSISITGLRMPIEVFELETPRPPLRYGLLSGYRRYHALLKMHEDEVAVGLVEPRFGTIPAFIRPRAALTDQLAALVEENAVRSDLSPWEQGHAAMAAWRAGIFETLDEAVAKLYRSASRQKRARLRAIAQVVEELDGCLSAPEFLSQRRIMRLSHAIQAGFGEIMRDALDSSSRTTPEAEWELILPYLIEAEQQPLKNAPPPRPSRPRRLARIRQELHIRRAMTQDGWVLHFSGEEATCDFVSEIIDHVERMFGR